jgi:hypothetical protein
MLGHESFFENDFCGLGMNEQSLAYYWADPHKAHFEAFWQPKNGESSG